MSRLVCAARADHRTARAFVVPAMIPIFLLAMLSNVISSLPDLTNTPVLICEHHAGKVYNLHARQRKRRRSALHVGVAVNHCLEPRVLTSTGSILFEGYVQRFLERLRYALAKFDGGAIGRP